MNWVRIGRSVRAIRLRSGLRQGDLAGRAGVSRSSVSLLERAQATRLSVETVEAIVGALGARLDGHVAWQGPELDRLLDENHARLGAALKHRLERWGWLVQVEVSFNHYGDRGRIDLLAYHPRDRLLLVIELKTALADVQALLGGMDIKARLAPRLASRFGWAPAAVVPAIMCLEDRTLRRRVDELGGLFDRYAVRGRSAITWLRRPVAPAPTGLMWFVSLPNARVVRISGQRVRRRR